MGGFCGSSDPVAPNYIDPLGPSKTGAMGPTGGPEARDKIFGTLENGIYPAAQGNAEQAVAGTQAAANNPGWGQLQGYLRNGIGGQYLNANPYLDRAFAAQRGQLGTELSAADKSARSRLDATRATSMADLSGQQAGMRSNFGRAGQSFSTTAGQAQDAIKAALAAQLGRGEQTAITDLTGQGAAARSALEAQQAQQLVQNYQSERAAQDRAAAVLPSAMTGQASLLQSVPGLQYSGIAPAASIVQALAGGGNAIPQQFIQTPGPGNYIAQIAGIAGMAGY